MKAIKYIAIGGSVLLLGRYLYTLKRAEQQVVIVTSVDKDSISLQGLSIKVRYNIKNPTAGAMRMTPPLIKLSVNGKLIASSSLQMIDIPTEVRDKSGKIIIRAYKETGNIESKILIPWTSLLILSPDIIKRLKSNDKKDKVTLQADIISQIFSLVGNFPYHSKMAFQL